MTGTIVYDDCGVCTRSAKFLPRHGEFDFVGFSELDRETRDRLPDGWAECVHLSTDDRVARVARRWTRRSPAPTSLPIRLARRMPGYRLVRDSTYRFIADHRS